MIPANARAGCCVCVCGGGLSGGRGLMGLADLGIRFFFIIIKTFLKHLFWCETGLHNISLSVDLFRMSFKIDLSMLKDLSQRTVEKSRHSDVQKNPRHLAQMKRHTQCSVDS